MLSLGIALISTAGLLLEVTLTRILAVAQGYHFAFLVVSTALLGLGASGTCLTVSLWGRRGPSPVLLILGPVLFSVTAVASYLTVTRLPFDIVRLAWEPRQLGWLFLAYAVLAVPFFFSGLTVATALTRMADRVGRLYAADLVGAATGALLPLALYPALGAAGALLLAGWLGLLAAAVCWGSGAAGVPSPRMRVALGGSLLIAVGLLGGILVAPSWYAIRLSPYKGLMTALRYPEARHLATRWNALSRVDVVSSPAVRFAPGLSLTYDGLLPSQVGVTLDGDQLHAVTAVPEWRDASLEFLQSLPAAAPYRETAPGRVLVIEPGGGLDVLMALALGAGQVEVVERNPLLVEVVRRPAPGFVSRIYDDPRVRVHLADARAVLRASEAAFDLIVLSPLHALGASGIGLYGFAEDYSVTREAVAEYVRHLATDGWLVMTRYLPPVPLYDIRVVATLIETLERAGVPSPARHLIVLRSWGTLTLMLKRSPIAPEEVERLKAFAEAMRFDLDHYPGVTPDEVNRFNRFAEPVYYRLITQLLDPGLRARLYEAYPFEIRPVTDDRPFFGYAIKVSRLTEAYRLVHEKWLFFVEGGLLVPVMLVQAGLLAAVLILLPAALGTRRLPALSPSARTLLYFLLIALAFMGVEIAMIHRLVLFLGHPVYAVSAVLAALLLFAGIGSRLTASGLVRSGRGNRLVLVALGLLVVGSGLGLPAALSPAMGWSVAGRFVVALGLLAPLGLLMGMPFPLGIRALERTGHQALIPWAWAVNGSASVVAAILAVFIAMEVGLTGVFLGAGAAYLAAGWLVSGARPPA